MSGIVALFDRGRGGVTDDEIDTMLDRIDHRGPDGRNAWCDDCVGLGHQQLQSTPEAAYDQQPYRDDGLVITADARLDNRADLFDALSITKSSAPVPDSHLLLEAYRKWGEHCVDHLVGAYAFVIWDGNTNSVFCVRDHFGVKPIYYYRGEDVFAVASEIKALLELSGVPGRLNETAVGDFLTGLSEDKTNTFYEKIRRLPPAHAMSVDTEKASTWQYWDLDPSRKITLHSDTAYVRRFRELFDQAVQCRLRTDDAVATTLSGGLDSSSITAVARDLLPSERTLYTFSGVFEDLPDCDERDYIETLVQRDGIESKYVFVDDIPILTDIDRVLAYRDDPVHNTMHHMKWTITKRANECGIGVVLDGAHGDSAVGYGIGMLPQLARIGRPLQLRHELRSMSRVLDVSPRFLLVKHVLPWLVPDRVTQVYRRLRRRPIEEQRANPAIKPEFAQRIGLRDRHRRFDDDGPVRKRSASRWQYRSLMTGKLPAFLEANDVINAAFGVEPRYPFLDKRLVEFTLAVPPTQKLADGWTRMILRRALDDVLPLKIQWRPWKTMLNESFVNALESETDHLRNVVNDPGRLDCYLEMEPLREAYDRFRDEPNSRDARVLWKALSLSVWLEDVDVSASDRP